MKLPIHQRRHAAAIAAGQFSPHYTPHTEPMTTKHMQPIITNFRTGRPISARNRPRRAGWGIPFAIIAAAIALLWGLSSVVIASY